MMPAESASAFRGFLLARRVDIDAAALDEIAGAALDFYSTVSASGLAATAEADMLLFQVGLYDWGNGEHFESTLLASSSSTTRARTRSANCAAPCSTNRRLG
jgi:hypothetical protein